MLGPANTVVAIENVDMGRTPPLKGRGPPKLWAGDMERLKAPADATFIRESGGVMPYTLLPCIPELEGVNMVILSCDGLRQLAI